MESTRFLEELYEELVKWTKDFESVSVPCYPQLIESESDELIVQISMSAGNYRPSLEVNFKSADFREILMSPDAVDKLMKQATPELTKMIARCCYKDYELIFAHDFDQVEPVFVISDLEKCRFCNKQFSEENFKNESHAVPESVGNKTLFSKDECDDCNLYFGTGIEDHFGRWSNVQRTVFLVEGKKSKIPELTMRKGHVRSSKSLIEIKIPQESMARIDEDNKVAEITLIRPAHIPIAVIKAFHKMAISLLPPSEVSNFSHLIDWLRTDNHAASSQGACTTLLSSFYPGEVFAKTRCLLYKRLSEGQNRPYMTFILIFGNFCYQVVLVPKSELRSESFSVTPFCYLFDGIIMGSSNNLLLDMSSGEQKKNDRIELTLSITGPVRRQLSGKTESTE